VLSPPELRGRVMSAYIMASFGTQPIAALLVGAIGDAFGPAVALRFNGAMLLVGGILMMLRPGLLKWEVDHKAQSKMSMSEPPADDSLSPQPAARG
jgi:MFS family permease